MPSAEPPAPAAASAGALIAAPTAAAAATLAPGSPLRPLLGRAVLTLAGSLAVAELVGHSLHADGGAALGVGALAAGWWLLRRRPAPGDRPRPASLEGWQQRCERLIDQFHRLDPTEAADRQRRRTLEELLALGQPRPLRLALAGTRLPQAEDRGALARALRGPRAFSLLWGEPLASASGDWIWPEALVRSDALLYHLPLPLSAADLRWLDALPADLPLWLLLSPAGGEEREQAVAELLSQWPRADAGRLLFPAGDAAANTGLEAVGQWLAREQERLRTATPRRCLDALHGQWQAQLEGLRRRQWRDLLRRTQWLVAAGVVAAPLPSLDLLVLAIANGLLLREMAQLWDCPWSAEQLRLAALEIGRAALAYGVVEWSSQALGAAIQLHGATWLVGGAISALSAAYLTRVIGQAMADVMALGAGVSAPDLERIKREAPLLVARAAAAEQLDWAGFLQQGRQWLERQPLLQATS